jgi:hypothetical protein
VPVPRFLLFLYFRKVVHQIFSELDETKVEVNILPKRRQSPEGVEEAQQGSQMAPPRVGLGPPGATLT